MERNSMKLDLDLELKTNEVVVGQSIPMLVTLKNKDKKSQKIPFLIDTGIVTNFILYNEQEEIINEFNGVTIALNEGMPPDLTVSMVDLGKGESWNWDVDLLAYQRSFAIGKYFIQALYRFKDMDIEVKSKKEEFIVNSNQPVFMDVLQDQVMVNMLYTFQTHLVDKSKDEEVLFNMGYNSKPGSFLFGCTLKLDSGILPTISKVEFANAMDFDHDTYRWLAWKKDKSLFLTSVFRDEIKVEPIEVATDLKNPTFIPRPIQHQDKGVSLFVLSEQSSKKFVITKINFNEEAKEVARDDIITIDYKPESISVSATYSGEYHIVWGENGNLPVHWLKIDKKAKGKIKPIKIYPPKDDKSKVDPNAPIPDLLFLEPYLPIGAPTNHSILLSLSYGEQIEDKKKKDKLKDVGIRVNLYQIMIESDNKDVIPGPSVLIEGEINKLSPLSGHVVQNHDQALMGVLGTNEGSIYYIPPSGEMTQLFELEPNLARFSKVVIGGKGSVELFYLEDKTGINISTLIGRKL